MGDTSYPSLKRIASKSILAGGACAGIEYGLAGNPMNGLWLGGSQALASTIVAATEQYAPTAVGEYVNEAGEKRVFETLGTGAVYTGVMAFRGKSSLIRHFLVGTGSSFLVDMAYSSFPCATAAAASPTPTPTPSPRV